MYKPTTQQLAQDVEVAIKHRDRHLYMIGSQIKRYCGRAYYEAFKDEPFQPENHEFSFISQLVPQLIERAPKVRVKASRVVGHRVVAETMKAGLNAWIEQADLAEFLDTICYDFCFFQGIGLIRLEDGIHWYGGGVMPIVERLSFNRFGCDSRATSYDTAEFLWHQYEMHQDQLLEHPGATKWLREYLSRNRGALEGVDPIDKPSPFSRDKSDLSDASRNKVRLVNIWIRSTNTVRTIVQSVSDAKEDALEPFEWYGPAYCGPYVPVYAYKVPDSPYPLSPLVAVADQIREANIHAESIARTAMATKKIVLVNSAAKQTANAIITAKHGHVVLVDSLDANNVQEIEFGAPSKSSTDYYALTRDRLERNSGMSEVSRGQVTGDATATENQIASNAIQSRIGHMRRRFIRGTAKIVDGVGWYLFHTPGVAIPVSIKDPTTRMDDDGLFLGGEDPMDEGASWEDFRIEIDATSMQAQNDAAMRTYTMQWAQWIVQTAQMIPMMPYLRWDELIEVMGETLDQHDAQRFIDWDMLSQLVPMAYLPGAPQMPASMATGQGQMPQIPAPGQKIPSSTGVGPKPYEMEPPARREAYESGNQLRMQRSGIA